MVETYSLGDAYPDTAYSTGPTVTFPGWALDGDTEATLARLRGGERERIRPGRGRLHPERTPRLRARRDRESQRRPQPAVRGPEPGSTPPKVLYSLA
jgi:hypothetical protein